MYMYRRAIYVLAGHGGLVVEECRCIHSALDPVNQPIAKLGGLNILSPYALVFV